MIGHGNLDLNELQYCSTNLARVTRTTLCRLTLDEANCAAKREQSSVRDSVPSADVSMPVISVLSMSETSDPKLKRGLALAAGETEAPARTMRGAACRSALAF